MPEHIKDANGFIRCGYFVYIKNHPFQPLEEMMKILRICDWLIIEVTDTFFEKK